MSALTPSPWGLNQVNPEVTIEQRLQPWGVWNLLRAPSLKTEQLLWNAVTRHLGGLEASGTPSSVLNREASHRFVTSSGDRLQRWKSVPVRAWTRQPDERNYAQHTETKSPLPRPSVHRIQLHRLQARRNWWLPDITETVPLKDLPEQTWEQIQCYLGRKPPGIKALSLNEISKLDLKSQYLYKLF